MSTQDTARLLWDTLQGKTKVVTKDGTEVPGMGMWGRIVVRDVGGYNTEIIAWDKEIFVTNPCETARAYVEAIQRRRAKGRKGNNAGGKNK